jgi:hypothetical protein
MIELMIGFSGAVLILAVGVVVLARALDRRSAL